MKTILGDVLTGEAEVRWNRLSPADRMVLMRAKAADTAAKAAASRRTDAKPELWDKFSNLDRAQWHYQQKREGK